MVPINSFGVCSSFSGVDTPADETRNEVPDRSCEKPNAHHLPDESARAQFCHRRKTDGTDQQFAKRLEKIANGQPPA